MASVLPASDAFARSSPLTFVKRRYPGTPENRITLD